MKISHASHEPLDTSAEVETPEHVRFHHQLAGPARRGLAWLIDLSIRGMLMLFLAMLTGIAGIAAGAELRSFSAGVLLLVYFVVEWGYYVFWETIWSGRSPGKRAMRLRVITDSGRPLHFLDSVLRNLVRGADWLPMGYALGLIVMGRDKRFRRLGDFAAGTMVVVEERQALADPLYIQPPPTARELGSLPQRVPLSGDEIEALELFLRRVPRLHPARSEELAEIVAPVFAKRIGVRFRGDARRFLEVLYYRTRERTAQ
jgi:uncharacterized RDD family membrane protein YckC